MSICGVLLTEDGIKELGKAIEPYMHEGSIGKFIECAMAVQNGNFIDMTFDPSHTNGSVKDRMIVSVPLHFVKFMVTGAKTLPIGFAQSE